MPNLNPLEMLKTKLNAHIQDLTLLERLQSTTHIQQFLKLFFSHSYLHTVEIFHLIIDCLEKAQKTASNPLDINQYILITCNQALKQSLTSNLIFNSFIRALKESERLDKVAFAMKLFEDARSVPDNVDKFTYALVLEIIAQSTAPDIKLASYIYIQALARSNMVTIETFHSMLTIMHKQNTCDTNFTYQLFNSTLSQRNMANVATINSMLSYLALSHTPDIKLAVIIYDKSMPNMNDFKTIHIMLSILVRSTEPDLALAYHIFKQALAKPGLVTSDTLNYFLADIAKSARPNLQLAYTLFMQAQKHPKIMTIAAYNHMLLIFTKSSERDMELVWTIFQEALAQRNMVNTTTVKLMLSILGSDPKTDINLAIELFNRILHRRELVNITIINNLLCIFGRCQTPDINAALYIYNYAATQPELIDAVTIQSLLCIIALNPEPNVMLVRDIVQFAQSRSILNSSSYHIAQEIMFRYLPDQTVNEPPIQHTWRHLYSTPDEKIPPMDPQKPLAPVQYPLRYHPRFADNHAENKNLTRARDRFFEGLDLATPKGMKKHLEENEAYIAGNGRVIS